MNFITLVLNRFKDYSYKDASNIEMNVLGIFLSSDFRCYRFPYKEWALDPSAVLISGNITRLEKEGGYIF